MWIDGEKIKQKRLDLGLTQCALSKGICTQATISHIENKNHVPRVKTAQLVCKKLDLTLDANLLLKADDMYHDLITDCFSLYLSRNPIKLRRKLDQVKFNKLKNPYLIVQYYIMIAYLEYHVRKYEIADKAILLAQKQLTKDPHAYYELIILTDLMIINSIKGQEKQIVYYGKLAYTLAIKLMPSSANESTIVSNCLYDIAEVYQKWNYSNLALKIINLIIKNHQKNVLQLAVYGKAYIMKSYLAKNKQQAINDLVMGCLIGTTSTDSMVKKNQKQIIEKLINTETSIEELHNLLHERKRLFNNLH